MGAFFRQIFLISIAFGILIGCSENSANVSSEASAASASQITQSGYDLGSCTIDKIGLEILVYEEMAYYICSQGGLWVRMTVKDYMASNAESSSAEDFSSSSDESYAYSEPAEEISSSSHLPSEMISSSSKTDAEFSSSSSSDDASFSYNEQGSESSSSSAFQANRWRNFSFLPHRDLKSAMPTFHLENSIRFFLSFPTILPPRIPQNTAWPLPGPTCAFSPEPLIRSASIKSRGITLPF